MSATGRPVISVCIANYNGKDVLLPCVESVLAQSCTVPVEILVHDDASTDDAILLLEQTYPHIRILRSSENVGFCISNNRLAREASGDYLLLLNNDATLRSGSLQAMLDAAEQGFSGILSVAQYDAGTGALLDRGCAMDVFLMPIPINARSSRRVVTVMGACLWIPRSMWMAAGGFPEWLESIGEDLFLCLAAWNQGGQVRVVEGGYDHIVGHSFGGGKAVQGGLRTTVRRRFLSERNRLCVGVVFCPALLLPFWMAVQVISMLIEGLLLSLVRCDSRVFREVYIAALASAWRLRKAAISERRRVRLAFGRFPLLRWLSLVSLIPQKLRAIWRHGIPDVR